MIGTSYKTSETINYQSLTFEQINQKATEVQEKFQSDLKKAETTPQQLQENDVNLASSEAQKLASALILKITSSSSSEEFSGNREKNMKFSYYTAFRAQLLLLESSKLSIHELTLRSMDNMLKIVIKTSKEITDIDLNEPPSINSIKKLKERSERVWNRFQDCIANNQLTKKAQEDLYEGLAREDLKMELLAYDFFTWTCDNNFQVSPKEVYEKCHGVGSYETRCVSETLKNLSSLATLIKKCRSGNNEDLIGLKEGHVQVLEDCEFMDSALELHLITKAKNILSGDSVN